MSSLNPEAEFDGRDEPAERTVTLYKAAELAMRGLSYRAIASELNVNHDTIRRALNSAEGQRMLREAREEHLSRTGRMMSSLGMVALQTLGQALASEETVWKEKIAAASKILDLHHRHTVSIEGIQPGQSITISQESDDLAWLKERAERLRTSIEKRETLDIVEVSEVQTDDESRKTAN